MISNFSECYKIGLLAQPKYSLLMESVKISFKLLTPTESVCMALARKSLSLLGSIEGRKAKGLPFG